MQLRVLCTSDGLIVSLARHQEAVVGDFGRRPPRIAVQPGEGQHVAIVDLDAMWAQRSLTEIHRAFEVAEGADGCSLRERGGKA